MFSLIFQFSIDGEPERDEMMPIATNIPTNLWHNVIALLIKDNWSVTYRYDNIDAGIDFDFVILEKENEEILFGWDNWLEGEIKCSDENMRYIESLAATQFVKGEPAHLKPAIIDMHRKWRIEKTR